jgi:predicted nucleic acid-binding protein
MKRVLLDTNIILDFALKRENFFENSKQILDLAYNKLIIAYISATTVTNIYYIAKKQKGREETIQFIRSILEFLEIATVDKGVVLDALELDFKDFEDAIQESSATNINIPIIITRNEADFKNSKLMIYNPEQFLREFLRESENNQETN